MGYFSNGTEGLAYQEKYCQRCVHDVKEDCRVWLAHLMENGNKESATVLDALIPRTDDKLGNEQCTMFLEKTSPKPNWLPLPPAPTAKQEGQ